MIPLKKINRRPSGWLPWSRLRTLLTLLTITVVLTVQSITPLSQVFATISVSWGSVAGVLGNVSDPPPFWAMSTRVNPVNGVAYTVGWAGSGTSTVSSNAIVLARSDNNSWMVNLDDQGIGSDVFHLDFGVDGTGYAVWRSNDGGWRGRLRAFDQYGNASAGVSLGSAISSLTGGNVMDQPAVAGSKMTGGYVYIVGQMQSGPGLGFVESHDNGNSFVAYNLLQDSRPSGVDVKPGICTSPNSVTGVDDIHVAAHWGGNINVYDRINGVWQGPTTISGNNGDLGSNPLSIGCGKDGYAYASFNTGNTTGMARYVPGTNRAAGGWDVVNYDIFPTSTFGSNSYTKADDVAVSADANGTVWFTTLVLQGSPSGLMIAASENRGLPGTFVYSNPIPYSDIGNGVAQVATYIPTNASTTQTRVYASAQFKNVRRAYYNSTAFTISSPAPSAPVITGIGGVDHQSIGLTWSFSSTIAAAGFNVYRSSSAAGTYTQVGTASSTATSYTDSGLSPDTVYYYQLKAFTSDGILSVASNTVSGTTLPYPPTLVSATALDFQSVSLAWAYNSATTQYGFLVSRGTSAAGPFIALHTGSSAERSFTDTGLAYGTDYYYQIKTIGTNNSLSLGSNIVGATTTGPAYLKFDQQPGVSEPGLALSTQPIVSVYDVAGRKVTNYTGNVTLSIKSGTTGATITNGTQAVTAGTATFSGVSLSHVGNYVLTASLSSPSLSVDSSTVRNSAKLVFTVGPATPVYAKGTFSLTIQVQRATDNVLVSNYNGYVKLGILPGTGKAGATLNISLAANAGNLTTAASSPGFQVTNGQLVVDSLFIDKLGGNYQLVTAPASTDPLVTGVTSSFDVNGKLVVNTPSPASPSTNSSFSVSVEVHDGSSSSSLLSDYTDPVRLAVATAPSGGNLSGVLTLNAVNGIATFTNLGADTAGSYTLSAIVPSLSTTTGTGSAFTVNTYSGCNPILVKVNTDATGSACASLTLRDALSNASSGSDKIVRLDRTVLGSGVVAISLSSGLGNLSVPAGVGIDGGCLASKPGLQLTTVSGAQFVLQGNNIIRGLLIAGPGQRVLVDSAAIARNNLFSCSAAQP